MLKQFWQLKVKKLLEKSEFLMPKTQKKYKNYKETEGPTNISKADGM